MRQHSTGNDELVNVDNFVEIGDFSSDFGRDFKKQDIIFVEKSIYGFQFMKRKIDSVNPGNGNAFDGEWQIVVYWCMVNYNI